MKHKRFTEKRNGKNVIPLRNAVCGVGLPKWSIEEHSDIQSFLSGDAVDRLAEFEDKIEQGTLIECNPKLIGECVVGIHQHTDGTYSMELGEENIVIGFCIDGIVTANTTHSYNDYFKNGLYFIDNEEGRAKATNKLKELENG